MEKQMKFWLPPMLIGIIGIAWLVWGIVACFCKGIPALLIVLSHVSFLIFFIFAAFVSYKALLLLIASDEKEKEFKRKKDWNELQKRDYEECKGLDNRIKTICENILLQREPMYKKKS
jgi:hypothetical protein